MKQFDAYFSPEKKTAKTNTNIELKEIIIDKPPYKNTKISKISKNIKIKIIDHEKQEQDKNKDINNYEEWDMI